MNQPINREFGAHAPAATAILFHYLSKIFVHYDIPILKRARPTITAADMEIVERALKDEKARSAIMSRANEHEALLDCMGNHFNHALYTDGFSKIAYAAEFIYGSTQRLVQSGHEHSRHFEEDARGLLKTQEDGRISLALPNDGTALTELVSNMQRNIENYSGEYCDTSKAVSDLLVAAMGSWMQLAKAFHVKLEQ
ncbi:hypothetical protein E0Z10_g9096 [Xylaria hypoxylon]|uniref:Uncharacterized protein n=1 Tax=Xylaria hypoxylon TaxID=37992 RepID=A0A4Z0Y9N0_9PEZI|nr:hypothetical protein E0Z10_g9096 [Xylaria hypoxylon]